MQERRRLMPEEVNVEPSAVDEPSLEGHLNLRKKIICWWHATEFVKHPKQEAKKCSLLLISLLLLVVAALCHQKRVWREFRTKQASITFLIRNIKYQVPTFESYKTMDG